MPILQIPVLQDNYTYLIYCDQTGELASVDSPDASATRSQVKRLNSELGKDLNFNKILNTHHHWDHAGGNADLLSKAQLEVYAGFNDKERIDGVTHPVREGDEVSVGHLNFKVLDIPGHTLGHVAYYGHGLLICGDTLFLAGCGRLFEGSPEQMMNSLAKLKNLPDETLVYCMHEYSEANLKFAMTLEPENQALQNKYQEVLDKRSRNESTVPSTIAEEKSYNPFLRWDAPELISTLEKKHGLASTDPLSVFTLTRELKNNF